MTEKLIDTFNRDKDAYGLQGSLEIHSNTVSIELLQTFPLDDLITCLSKMTNSKYDNVKGKIFSVYLEDAVNRDIKTIAKDYTVMESQIPKEVYGQKNVTGTELLFKVIEEKLDKNIKNWEKATSLFLSTSVIGRMIHKKVAEPVA